MDPFDFVSPLDTRYLGRNKELFEKARPYLSENARIAYQLKVEAALGKALAKNGICSSKVAREIESACNKVKAEEVYRLEAELKHDIRALAECIRRKVSAQAKPFVHLAATSYDIVDTATALRYKEACEKLILPSLRNFEKTLISLAMREKATVQIGRTHGQHAVPITFGLSVASYVSRLGNRIKALEAAKESLCGKFSGAVGAYNASSLILKDSMKFEKDVLSILGLKKSIGSTQIVEPEPVADFGHVAISTFSVLANLADDMRNLQRTEIAEVAEAFGKKQVGSSTMPHKRNPINFENVKSFWKAFMPRQLTLYLDQISEHQRDLTNSASGRFAHEILAGLFFATEKMNQVMEKVVVDKQKMLMNLESSSDEVIAEPLYILLAKYGHSNAHGKVNECVAKAKELNWTLMDVVEQDKSLKAYVNKFSSAERALLKDARKYTGLSERKTVEICKFWKKELGL